MLFTGGARKSRSGNFGVAYLIGNIIEPPTQGFSVLNWYLGDFPPFSNT